MSSTHYSESDHSRAGCSHRGASPCGGGHWRCTNIVAMVLGFIVFWPLGFVVLWWTIKGEPIEALPGWVRDTWRQMFRDGRAAHRHGDNSVFNEYQQTQYDRIREIKEEIKRRARAFRDFRFDARRRQDQKEFDEFMASNPDKAAGSE